MVNFCAVVGCCNINRGDRNNDKSFYRLPTIIRHQGRDTEIISKRRQHEWLRAIQRKDIKTDNYPYTRVCSDHFISGKPSSLYVCTNPDWISSINLGYCIAGKFGGGNFGDSAGVSFFKKHQRVLGCQNLANWHQFAKFAKFIFLQFYPLYGTSRLVQIMKISVQGFKELKKEQQRNE